VIIEQEGRQVDRALTQERHLWGFGIYCALNNTSAQFLEVLKRVPKALMRDDGDRSVLQWGGIKVTQAFKLRFTHSPYAYAGLHRPAYA
jgi:hypothetical protein